MTPSPANDMPSTRSPSARPSSPAKPAPRKASSSHGTALGRDSPALPPHAFPPPHLRPKIHPDDLKDKTLMAICATLVSVVRIPLPTPDPGLP